MKKQESDEQSSPKNEEKVLDEAKKQHKGRYPKAVAETVKQTKMAIKEKKDGTLVQTDKLDLFLAELLKNGGNATAAAMVVFNCKSRATASVIGTNYLAKARQLGRVVMEEKGYHYGKMLEVAAKKMEESKTPEWWDRLMKIGGYEDFMAKTGPAPTTVNIMAVQKDLMDEYVDGEVVEDEE